MRVKKLFKALFSRKRKRDTVQVYLSRFNTLETYLKEMLLGIDLKEGYVTIDQQIHVLYMFSDKKYAAFFDTVRAYINYRRGALGLPMIELEDRINFVVTSTEMKHYDMDTGEFYSPPKRIAHLLLIGYYQDGIVVYDRFNQNEKS